MKFKRLNIEIAGTPLYIEDGQPYEYVQNYLRILMKAYEKMKPPEGFDSLFGNFRK